MPNKREGESPAKYQEKFPDTFTQEYLQQQINLDSEATMEKVDIEKIDHRDKVQRKLASIVQESLEISQVGIEDNFFELAGDSLEVIMLFNRIEDELNQFLPSIVLIEEAQTISKMTDYLIQTYPELVNKLEENVEIIEEEEGEI